jgi:acetyltransferase-like isoleucine patch superfamily enzyme
MIIKRIIKYIFFKIKFRKKLKFSFTVNIGMNSIFEGMNKIYGHSIFYGEMGFGSYIANDCVIFGKIGRYSSIAPFVQCIMGRHPIYSPFVSTSPAFYSLLKQNGGTFVTKQKYEEIIFADNENKYSIIIGNDCWIGYGASIINGIKIGDGAVVLAHAVVTKDVMPYAIVGGVPAHILKYRYEQDEIDLLLKFKWWNKDITWIKNHIELFSDMEKFKDCIIKEGT